jgi:hypothetical protein
MKVPSISKFLNHCPQPSSFCGRRVNLNSKMTAMKTGGRALHPLVEEVLLSGDEISLKIGEVGRYGSVTRISLIKHAT